jgi:WS/DGAT/MGAT family acyltransferase
MADAKKLSSMDASFLYLETPEMPMHVGSMAIFRLPDDYKGDFFEDFKAMIASRLHVAPILKARLEKAPLDIDHPSWVEDDQFDIDRHIFRGSLPAPHDRATLERIVGWMHAKLLNRARPLWEFYVFEGMKDNEIGLYSKMHHACIDGGAGAALTNMIYDVTPVPRKDSAVRCRWCGQGHRSAALGKKRSRIDPVRQRHVPDRIRGEVCRQHSHHAENRLRCGRKDFRPEISRQYRQHDVADDRPEQIDFIGAQLRRRVDLAVRSQGAGQTGRRQAE